MRITSISATPVSVPTTVPCAWSLGTCFGFTRTILEITTSDGLVGLGECGTAAASYLLNGRVGRELIGLPVDEISSASRVCRMDSRDHGSISEPALLKAYAAIEMALLDLQGKAAGVPIYKLLGGAVRPHAEFGAYSYSSHLETSGLTEKDVPEAMAAYASQALARTGAKLFEIKIGRYSLSTDIETIRTVRQVIGNHVAFGIDANQALTIDSTRQLLAALTSVRIDWFEEPVPSLDEMTRLHLEYPAIALSSHCTDPDKMKFYPAIEGVVGDLHIQGGIRGMMRSSAIFSALGHRFWQRACLELGISWAAMVHAGIACPDITRASQSLIDHVENDLILGDPWLVENGGVVPPNKPGLGVDLDRAALAHYAEEFRRRGELTFFDAK